MGSAASSPSHSPSPSPSPSPTKRSVPKSEQVSFYLGGDDFDEDDEPKDFPTPSGIQNMAELRVAANAITILNVPERTLSDMPPNVLAIIASHVMEVPVEEIEEVRACGCLGQVTKPFPFRCGETTNFYDQSSQTDIRRDLVKCPLDHGDFNDWCLKQNLGRAPGRKHPIPNFAACSKKLYKKWRDATAYVFCCENCVEKAIMRLPAGNKRMMTRIRFFERDNKYNIEGLGMEGYAMWADAWSKMLTYQTQGNQRIVYRGKKVWIKELVLPGERI